MSTRTLLSGTGEKGERKAKERIGRGGRDGGERLEGIYMYRWEVVRKK